MSSEGRPLDLQAILAGADPEAVPPGHKSGMVALVGRPNVGKSTLLNAMVGQKLAIVTEVPGTTRTAIRGVLTRPDAQLVFVDTPGLAKPRTLLTRRLNEVVRASWSGVDVICFLVDVAAGVGSGDQYLAEQLPRRVPTVIVANKEDAVRDKHRMIPQLAELAELVPEAEVVPTSATAGTNVGHLIDVVVGLLPEGPRLFPEGVVTDQPERTLAAELLREQLITRMHEELPHSIAVVVESIREAEHREDLVEIDATVFVERESQKGIVIGHRGEVIKQASTAARAELETVFGRQVFLQTRVKVAKEWQRDPKQLGRLGY